MKLSIKIKLFIVIIPMLSTHRYLPLKSLTNKQATEVAPTANRTIATFLAFISLDLAISLSLSPHDILSLTGRSRNATLTVTVENNNKTHPPIRRDHRRWSRDAPRLLRWRLSLLPSFLALFILLFHLPVGFHRDGRESVARPKGKAIPTHPETWHVGFGCLVGVSGSHDQCRASATGCDGYERPRIPFGSGSRESIIDDKRFGDDDDRDRALEGLHGQDPTQPHSD